MGSIDVVIKSAAGHKLFCENTEFVSKRIGEYELPNMDHNQCRFSSTNAKKIYCSQSTATGKQNFLITKFFSIGTNVHLRKIYGSNDVLYCITLFVQLHRLLSVHRQDKS